MPDHNPANRRGRHELNPRIGKLLRDRSSKRFRLLWKLKHTRTLKIDRAVQPAGQLKVPFQQRAGLFELVDYLFRIQVFTS